MRTPAGNCILQKNLKQRVVKYLQFQGFSYKDSQFYLTDIEKEDKRKVHETSRAEKIVANLSFINSKASLIQKYTIDSEQLEPLKISPRIIEVKPNTEYADIFRWWNLVWWSLPFEKAYGRQMRFIIWDDYHEAPIGLIGLQSPILSWNVRDKYLGIKKENRDFWVNQSLNAQRIGSLPPYNSFLGGKLVSSLMTSEKIVNDFRNKYSNQKTILLSRKIPANLLFITTTGAFGKSSIYNRLKHEKENVCKFIGYSNGNGSFHIPNTLYESLIYYLLSQGHKAGRSYGNGPSAKMKIIDKSMNMLGFKNGVNHGIKRGVYLFELVENLHDVINKNAKPKWILGRNEYSITQFWKDRWLVKRLDSEYPISKLHFSTKTYLENLEKDIAECQKIIKKLDDV